MFGSRSIFIPHSGHSVDLFNLETYTLQYWEVQEAYLIGWTFFSIIILFIELPLFFYIYIYIYIYITLFIYLFVCLFIYGCTGSSLLHTGFLQLWRAGATLRCGAQASHCGIFSCCGAQALGMRASVVAARRLSCCGSQALECRLSSCGPRAQLLRGMWDLPGPGLEPLSPALAGGFLTTAPPGKPRTPIILMLDFLDFLISFSHIFHLSFFAPCSGRNPCLFFP